MIAITALILSVLALICVVCCVVGGNGKAARTNEKWECPRCKGEAIGLYQGECGKYSFYHLICPECNYDEDVLYQHKEGQ